MLDVERAITEATPEDMEAEALGAIPDQGEDAPEEKAGTLRPIRPDEVYSALELKQIIDVAAAGLERALLMTAMLTGLRHGELNALRWSTVNLKTGRLFVNRSLTQLKGGPVSQFGDQFRRWRNQKPATLSLCEVGHWKLSVHHQRTVSFSPTSWANR